MKNLTILLMMVFCVVSIPVMAQDALDLPTALYILLNDGRVERYGLGAEGVQTITPDEQFVVDFGIASDDNWFAYRTLEGLSIANVYDASQVQLVDENADVPPIRGSGDTVVWSPDDAMIAYSTMGGVRVYLRIGDFIDIPVSQARHIEWSPSSEFLLVETVENIWWVYRRVGGEMLLASVIPSSHGIAWWSDTVLIFAPIEGGLLTMDLNDNNAQSTILDASSVYGLPYQMGENIYRVFAKNEADNTGDLLLIQIDENGRVIQESIGEGSVEVNRQVRWSANGNLLIQFQDGSMALVDPISASGFTLPITGAVSYDWGAVQSNMVDSLDVVGDLYFLGEDVMGVRQVWTLDDDGTPVSVTTATGEITDYDVSPDGGTIAYVSQGQLWVYDRNDDTVTSLVEAREPIRHPRFSPDGGRIAYSVDTVDDSQAGGIWMVTIASEDNDRLLTNGASGDVTSPPFYSQPQFAPNINALLLTVDGTETRSLSVLDVNTLEVVPLGQFDEGFWLQDGRVLAWTASEIVILDPNTQQEPISLFSLPENVAVDTIVQTASDELRLITHDKTFGPSTMINVRIPLEGTFERLFAMTAVLMPTLSPDALSIAGLTRPDGHLMILNPDNEMTQILSSPTRVGLIMWK